MDPACAFFNAELLITYYQGNECLWNHNCTEYHEESNKDLLYDLLIKELEDKYDVDDIKKKWKELLRRFKQEHAKASVKPSGAGTADIYQPSWEFYKLMKYVNVICNDTDETVNSISGSSIPRVKKLSKQQQRDADEMKEPEASTKKDTSVENSEVAAVANYVRLTMSKLNPCKFRRAKMCIGDILFQIEESDELEAVPCPLDFIHLADIALLQL